MTSKSAERQTVVAVVSAFNIMDIDTILAYRTPDCMRYILPSTLGHAPTNNEQYRNQLERLRPVFQNFRLTIQEPIVEDRESHRICMWLKARADTLAGEYINEYMWTLDFDDTARIKKVNEFVDTVMNRDFWPKLQQAMKDRQASTTTSS